MTLESEKPNNDKTGFKTDEVDKRRKLASARFCSALKKHGINLSSGVPCGVQKYVIYHLMNSPEIPYIPAAREEDAIGIAVGAYLAGRKPLVLMQNSGLANCMNAFVSLLIPYKIPILFLVTWRGYPGEDAPQHFVMGWATTKLLNVIRIPAMSLSKENFEAGISSSIQQMKEKQIPAVMLVRRGIL